MKPREGVGGGGEENKGALPPAEAATAASRQPAAGWEPAPLLAAPGGRGSSSHPAGAAADPPAGGAAAGRLRGEGLRQAWGGEGRLSGAGREGTARHRCRDAGGLLSGEGGSASCRCPPPWPRGPSQGASPRASSGARGGGAARSSEGGWRCLLVPRGRGASREGADGGGVLSRHRRLPGLPPLSQAPPSRSAPRQPRLRLPAAPRLL